MSPLHALYGPIRMHVCSSADNKEVAADELNSFVVKIVKVVFVPFPCA